MFAFVVRFSFVDTWPKHLYKWLFAMVAFAAFVALIFTKSRTALAASLAAQLIFLFLSTKRSVKFFAVLTFLGITSFLLLFFWDASLAALSSVALFIREEQEFGQFGGRWLIWSICLEYLEQRPLVGFGFNSFWSVAHIKTISARLGTGMMDAHSAYLDLALGLGIIGLGIYIAIMSISIRRSWKAYRAEKLAGYSFHFKLGVYYLMHGLVESGIVETGFGTFILVWSLMFLIVRGREYRSSVPDDCSRGDTSLVGQTRRPRGNQPVPSCGASDGLSLDLGITCLRQAKG